MSQTISPPPGAARRAQVAAIPPGIMVGGTHVPVSAPPAGNPLVRPPQLGGSNAMVSAPGVINQLAPQQAMPAPPAQALTPQMAPPPPAPAPTAPAGRLQLAAQQLQGMQIPPSQIGQQVQRVTDLIEILAPLARDKSAVPFKALADAADRSVRAGKVGVTEAASFLAHYDPKAKDLRPAIQASLTHAVMLAVHLAAAAQSNAAPPVPGSA